MGLDTLSLCAVGFGLPIGYGRHADKFSSLEGGPTRNTSSLLFAMTVFSFCCTGRSTFSYGQGTSRDDTHVCANVRSVACRSKIAALTQEKFNAAAPNMRVRAVGDKIVFSDRSLFKSHTDRASFHESPETQNLEKALCRFGFVQISIESAEAAASKRDEYALNCSGAAAPVKTLAQCDEQARSRQVTGSGRVRGTLTFFFNQYQGTKPDVGAVVALVPGFLEIANDSFVLLVPGMLSIDHRPCYLVASTVADGSGNFELDGVPVGEYTAVMISNHVKGGLHSENVTTDKKGKPLKHPKVVERSNLRDMGGRVVTLHFAVQDQKTTDESFDFGITVF